VDPDLVERIKAWRLERSRELGVPAYVICTDATLLAIAELRPSSPQALLEIPGIGPAKLEQHGAQLLALVRDSD
jgi:DNA helicase-2/ATP-dependent DNA helicase PcrA